jgi:hypothetical protein
MIYNWIFFGKLKGGGERSQPLLLAYFSLGKIGNVFANVCIKVDFQSSHEAPHSSLRVHA